jgi:hypothetical protein
MAADETSICNLALGKIGDKTITSLDESSNQARACKRFYAQCRDELLRMHPWNFAIARAQLSKLPTAPVFGWAAQYQLPTDLIRIRSFNDVEVWDVGTQFELEGGLLLTDMDEAKIRYVRREENANKYDPLFVTALATLIASEIAFPLTNDKNLSQLMLAAFQQVHLPRARRIDAVEDQGRRRFSYMGSALVASRRFSDIG